MKTQERRQTTFTNAEEIGVKDDFLNMNGYTISSSKLKENLVGLSIYLKNEGITSEYGQIQVYSGDRGDVQNASAGGVKGSLHLTGKAADISINGLSNEALAKGAASSGLFGGVVYYPNRGNKTGFGTYTVPQEVSTMDGRIITTGSPNTVTNHQNLGPHVHVDQRSGSYLGRYTGFNPTLGSKGKNTYTNWKSKTSIW